MPFELAAAAATRTGTRKHNEDAFVAHRLVCAVADGMGGHAAGDVASAVVASTLNDLGAMGVLDAQDMRIALLRAHHDLAARNSHASGSQRMGTTVSGIALVGPANEHCLVFNVGDSRTYRLRDGVLQQLTTDHSLVQELVDAGEIDAHEAASHPQRNVITRVMGGADEVEIDMALHELRDGDRFFICSDGVSGTLTDEQIASMLGLGAAEPVVERIVEGALNAGSRDNVTAVIVDVAAILDSRHEQVDATQPRDVVDDDTQPREVFVPADNAAFTVDLPEPQADDDTVRLEAPTVDTVHAAATENTNHDEVAIAEVPFDLSHLKRGSGTCE